MTIRQISAYRTLEDLDVSGKTVLVRVDLNVPVKDGTVTDVTRIERTLPTLCELENKGAKVLVLLAHFGRPKGAVVLQMSLEPVAGVLQSMLGRPVEFVATDWRDGRADDAVKHAQPGAILLMENTRFHPGEETNDSSFAAQLARLGDVYVNDAFSVAHRAHASTEGVARLLPSAAGLAMQAELEALTGVFDALARPVLALVGGAKVATKIELLRNLVREVDTLALGGAMANTFLAVQGNPIGRSLAERDMLDTARGVIAAASASGCEIVLPIDAVVAQELEAGAAWNVIPVQSVSADQMILDIGPGTVALIGERLTRARTLVWNGTLGAFETEPFDRATNSIAETAARLTREGALRSVAGGGDTVAALKRAGVASDFTFLSTAGGAFLEWFEGKSLPGVEALRTI
ncbi:MAG: phosphoglycerate kinase [Burkholderiaceae bacterium]|nr:phosphoglycerate kinase [Burkholderiaceae bacterium]